jgi:hypothetical protein
MDDMTVAKSTDSTAVLPGAKPSAALCINGVAAHDPPKPARRPKIYAGRLKTSRDYGLLMSRFLRAWFRGDVAREDFTASFYALNIAAQLCIKAEEAAWLAGEFAPIVPKEDFDFTRLSLDEHKTLHALLSKCVVGMPDERAARTEDVADNAPGNYGP